MTRIPHYLKLRRALDFMQRAGIPTIDGRHARQADIDLINAEYGFAPVAWPRVSYALQTERLPAQTERLS